MLTLTSPFPITPCHSKSHLAHSYLAIPNCNFLGFRGLGFTYHQSHLTIPKFSQRWLFWVKSNTHYCFCWDEDHSLLRGSPLLRGSLILTALLGKVSAWLTHIWFYFTSNRKISKSFLLYEPYFPNPMNPLYKWFPLTLFNRISQSLLLVFSEPFSIS